MPKVPHLAPRRLYVVATGVSYGRSMRADEPGARGDSVERCRLVLALMESTIGLYKTELIDHDRQRSWTGGRAEVGFDAETRQPRIRREQTSVTKLV